MSMQYSDLTTALGDLLEIPITNASSATPSSDTNFNNILPRIIDDAEQRIYRELDFLHVVSTDSSTAFTANTRIAQLPSATTFVVVNSVNVITPASTQPASGTRVPLERASVDFINSIWPTEQGGSLNSIPQYYAMLNDSSMIVAPTPNGAYVIEYTGVVRPAPMSSTNTTTYLGTTYPDIFLAACMVFAAGYQRDFGAQSDDPKMATSWEAHYQTNKQSAMEEAQRQKSQAPNWSPYSATPQSNSRK